ncbi:MAG: cache and HAMP domain-containing protein, partial [Pseudomonadota bacterium]
MSRASAELEALALERLTALNATKKQNIEAYFSTIRSQITSLANSTMTVDAMRAFHDSFHALPTLVDEGVVSLDEVQRANEAYYTTQFGARYAQETGQPYRPQSLSDMPQSAAIAQYLYISGNEHPLGEKDALSASPIDPSDYSRAHAAYHAHYREFQQKFEFYDVFLVDPMSGFIVYSVFKELDYGTSLNTGPYKDTNFARAFRKAARAAAPGEAFLVDYETYRPSYDAPASFIASPIFDGDERIGVLVFQMPVGRINAVMAQTKGLGDTGESYLVGDDKRMRSQSRFSDANTILSTLIDTPATAEVAAGNAGDSRFQGYRGQAMISAYTPVDIEGFDWGIVTEIEQDEALAAVSGLRTDGVLVGAVAVLVIGAFAWWFAGSVSRRVNAAVDVARNIAAGRFDNAIDDGGRDELGDMLGALGTMQSELFGRIVAEKNEALRITQALRSADTNVLVADTQGNIVFTNL